MHSLMSASILTSEPFDQFSMAHVFTAVRRVRCAHRRKQEARGKPAMSSYRDQFPSFRSDTRRLNSAGESMGTANAPASPRMSESPVTSASARPASANSRNGRSNGSRHSGIAGGGDRHNDGLAVRKVVIEQVALILRIQRKLGIAEDPDQFRSGLPADERADAAGAPRAP